MLGMYVCVCMCVYVLSWTQSSSPITQCQYLSMYVCLHTYACIEIRTNMCRHTHGSVQEPYVVCHEKEQSCLLHSASITARAHTHTHLGIRIQWCSDVENAMDIFGRLQNKSDSVILVFFYHLDTEFRHISSWKKATDLCDVLYGLLHRCGHHGELLCSRLACPARRCTRLDPCLKSRVIPRILI
jgi:hypothetical protein